MRIEPSTARSKVKSNALTDCAMGENTLSLNVQKTFFLVFHQARIKDHDLSIRSDGSTLNGSTNIKYFRVIIDHKLNWCEHIAHVKNKVSKVIGILYKARQFLDKKSYILT